MQFVPCLDKLIFQWSSIMGVRNCVAIEFDVCQWVNFLVTTVKTEIKTDFVEFNNCPIVVNMKRTPQQGPGMLILVLR